jgi:hypothetical protein
LAILPKNFKSLARKMGNDQPFAGDCTCLYSGLVKDYFTLNTFLNLSIITPMPYGSTPSQESGGMIMVDSYGKKRRSGGSFRSLDLMIKSQLVNHPQCLNFMNSLRLQPKSR